MQKLSLKVIKHALIYCSLQGNSKKYIYIYHTNPYGAIEAFLSCSICLENVCLCQCLKQFQSKPLTSAIKIFCSSHLKKSCKQLQTWSCVCVFKIISRAEAQVPWFGEAEISVILAVVCSGVPVFISAARGAVPTSDLTPRPGNWDCLHPMGLGRCEPLPLPFTMELETWTTLQRQLNAGSNAQIWEFSPFSHVLINF